jgi:hypothetical protein
VVGNLLSRKNNAPLELKGLVQELEEEKHCAKASFPREAEELLRVLQIGRAYLASQVAAEQLGILGMNGPQILRVVTAKSRLVPCSEVAS